MANGVPNGRWYRIVPILIVLNCISYMDRYNIGYAIAGGLAPDLGVSANYGGIAAGVFFWGYLVFQFPGGHLAERGYAKIFIAVALVIWSVLTISTAFVRTGPELMAVRFLVGLAEGGVFPAIYTILGNWFPARESGRASALFITNTAIASLISGPLAGYILSVYDWRALFVVEGLMSLAFAMIWIPLMSETPASARWLSSAERDYLKTEFAKDEQQAGDRPTARINILGLIRDRNLWILSAAYLCYHIANGGYVVWLPSIMKAVTKQGIGIVGVLTVTPFVLSFVGLYVFGTLSDKSQNRRRYIVVTMLGFALCFSAAAALSDRGWLSFCLLSASGLFLKPTISLFWTLPKVIFGKDTVGGARGIINGIGNLGGFFGPAIIGFASTYAGGFETGVYILSGFLCLGAVLMSLLPGIVSGRKEHVVPVSQAIPLPNMKNA
ncbi:MFS transporter [Bradyrhizobium sp. LTSP885]|uniref:MFS transporter n=1 Tax=Bradyrhizobium sp. LTSP885 TaxID=1619232 RepID=UPI0005C81CEC|nr:MFS transporter [Bradyrhizobium sp. LTSP885]